MKNKHVINIYNKVAREYSKRYDSIESEEDLVVLNAFLSYLEPGSRIVDLGCGSGYSTGYFVKKGMTAEGVDLSASMIEIARENYPKISFLNEDMRTFQPKTEVDAVWAGYSLFHLEQKDFENTLEKIKSYLKPNGVFGLVMLEGDGELEVDEPLLPGEKIYVHLYTEEQLKNMLKNHGFKLIDMKRKKPMYEMEFPFNKILLIACV